MLSSKQVGRKLSYKLNKTTSELYSSSGTDDTYKVSDLTFEDVLKHAERIRKFHIYYVDCPGTVEEIRQTIVSFRNLEEMKNKWIIVILDHTLLVKGGSTNSEREIISGLQRMFMEQKKYGRTTIIQLSQLNREIEDKDRINNPSLHYPMRRDVFGSDSIFQTTDYLLVLHRPEILGIEYYGPKKLPVKNIIYMHILKNREGEPKILSFENNLKYNRIDEVDPYNIINF
jgi:replicative DNA helicase